MRFIKEIEILPGYDKRNPDPKKNYGIHGCELRFALRSSDGRAVTFVAYTDWLPLNVQEEHLHDAAGKYLVTQQVVGTQPMAADISYHSPVAMNEWQAKEGPRNDCPYTKDGICFSDGSGLLAEPVRNAMLSGGSKAVWREMKKYYKDVFESGKPPQGFGAMIEDLKEALGGGEDEAEKNED